MFTPILFTFVFSVTPAPADAPRTREVVFNYQATIRELSPGVRARVWLPVPPSNSDQTSSLVIQELPESFHIAQEKKHGNWILFTEPTAAADGTVRLAVSYRVRRAELRADGGSQPQHEDLSKFLRPESKVPIAGEPLRLLQGRQLPADQLELSRVLYDVVENHMRYSKEGTGWGQGDSIWACRSKYGNCSDFHSLFISLARSQGIPATFEMGFPLPDERGEAEISGYHCWAKFRPNKRGWIPVDISEADKHPDLREYYYGNLTENRIMFTTGRDLELVPKQSGPPLNFFIYPYVEVDGKRYPDDKIERRFSFRDVE
jgi:hypothetical protein